MHLFLVRVFQALFTTIKSFLANGLQNHAAATALFLLLSVAPLLLLSVASSNLISEIFGTPGLIESALEILFEKQNLSYFSEIGIVPALGDVHVGGASLATLLFSSQAVLKSSQDAISVIFTHHKKRHFLVALIVPFIVLPIALFILLSAFVTSQLLPYVEVVGFFQNLNFEMAYLFNMLVLVGIAYCMAFLAYFFLPSVRPLFFPTAIVSALCVSSWFLIIEFAQNLIDKGSYIEIYGAFAGVAITVLLLFFLSAVFYFWAQFLKNYIDVDISLIEKLLFSMDEELTASSSRWSRFKLGLLTDGFGIKIADGVVVIQQGDISDKSIYILISGKVVMQIADPQTSSVVHQEILSPVTFFGEMSYLLEEGRSATVIADGDVVLLELSPEFFERLLAHTPNVSRLIIRKLSERVKLTNSDLVEKTLLAGG